MDYKMMDSYHTWMKSLARTMGVQLSSLKSPSTLENGVDRHHAAWEDIQLSKEERRGKSFEELQELRKVKWKALIRSDAEVVFNEDWKKGEFA